MPNITLDAIVLDADLVWSDEFSWNPVDRSAEYSLTGALITQEQAKLAGRPITLEAKSESRGLIWMPRTTIEALYAKSQILNITMVLTLSDARTFNVCFREDGFEATPVYHVMPHVSGDPYYLVLKLQTV
jgi:hypothetical protein